MVVQHAGQTVPNFDYAPGDCQRRYRSHSDGGLLNAVRQAVGTIKRPRCRPPGPLPLPV